MYATNTLKYKTERELLFQKCQNSSNVSVFMCLRAFACVCACMHIYACTFVWMHGFTVTPKLNQECSVPVCVNTSITWGQRLTFLITVLNIPQPSPSLSHAQSLQQQVSSQFSVAMSCLKSQALWSIHSTTCSVSCGLTWCFLSNYRFIKHHFCFVLKIGNFLLVGQIQTIIYQIII